MVGEKENVPAKRNAWPIVLAAIVFALLLLTSGVLAICGLTSYADSYGHEPERRWCTVAVVLAALLALTSAASELFLILRKRVAWITAAALLGLSVLGIGAFLLVGLHMVVAGEHRGGGDWAAVTGLVYLVLGILCPGLVGLLTLAGAGCLWAVRGRITESPA